MTVREFSIGRAMGAVLWKAMGELPLTAHFPRGAFKALRDARFERAVTVSEYLPGHFHFYDQSERDIERLERDDIVALRAVLIAGAKRPTFSSSRGAMREAADVCTKMLGMTVIDRLSELAE